MNVSQLIRYLETIRDQDKPVVLLWWDQGISREIHGKANFLNQPHQLAILVD